MNIERRDISTVDQLADLYGSQIFECPYEYEVTQDALRDAVCQPMDGLSDQLLLVATESGAALGFAHIGRGTCDNGPEKIVGVIRALIVPTDRGHDVGQALLDAAHEHFVEAGLSSSEIPGRYNYPCTRMSPVRDAWQHIVSLLEENDYQCASYFGGKQWIHKMIWSDMDPGEPTFPVPELDVEVGGEAFFPQDVNHGRAPRVTIKLFRDGKFMGGTEAITWHVPHWHSSPQDVCVTLTLGVNPDLQRRGIGRYLMERSLFEMKKAGCRHAILGVHASNDKAFALYKSMGFKTIYDVCTMAKPL